MGKDSPLHYPLELHIERALTDRDATLRAFTFQHSFVSVGAQENAKAPELAKALLTAYEAARGAQLRNENASMLVAFTTAWLCVVPLSVPEVGTARHEAWLVMPPPPPCALCGVVVCPVVTKEFPETAVVQAKGAVDGSALPSVVSTRAETEGILPGSPEYEAASREVRVASGILDSPAEIIGVWALTRHAGDS